jgi:hypothetical protein
MALIGINGYAGSGKDLVGQCIQLLHTLTDVQAKTTISRLSKNDDWWLEEQSGWEIKKFAGKLKDIASMLTGIPVEQFEDQAFKKTYLGPEWDFYTVSMIDNGELLRQEGRFNTKDEAERHATYMASSYGSFRFDYVVGMQRMTVRQFLQELGTDACRNELHPNTWVNALFADYRGEYCSSGPNAHLAKELQQNWIITDCRFPNEAKAIKDRGGMIIRIKRPGVTAVNAHPSETSLDDYPFDAVIDNDSTIEDLYNQVKYTIEKLNVCYP